MDMKNAGGRKLRSVRVRNARKVGLIFLRRKSCVSSQAERNLHKLTNELIAMQNALEAEKKRGEELDRATEALRSKHPLFRVPMEELSYEQLVELRDTMVNIRDKIQERVAELKNQEAGNPSSSDHAERPST